MKRKSYMISLLAVFVFTLSGCAAGIDSGKNAKTQTGDHVTNTNESAKTDSSSSGLTGNNASAAEIDAEMFTDRDYQTEYEKRVVEISLNKDSVSCDSDAVSISGSMAIIREEGTYVISGTLEDGMIVVDAEDTSKLQIVLNQAEITSSDSAALYVLEADKVFVTLADGTENVLANGGSFVAIDENNIDGAVYSKQDLTFNGAGSLSVTSPAGHGIVCKDDLVFTGGTYTICSASHALEANDSVRVTNASITVDAGKDGIHAENNDDAELGFIYISSGSFTIEAEGDGISAASDLQIVDGTFDITTGGGSENGTKSNSGNYGDFMGGGFMKGGGMGSGRPNRRSMEDGQTDEPGASNGNGMPEGAAAPDGSSMPEGMTAPDGNGFPAGVRAFDNSEPSGDTGSSDESTSMKGIKTGGNLQISGGAFTINSADDAVHSNTSINIVSGTFHLASGDDGIHADETLTVNGGVIDVAESYEGLEASHIIILDGDISVVATDDGLNAAGGMDSSGMGGRDNGMFGGRGMGGMSSGNGSIVISGGTLYINASGDGIDANGSLEITGGTITVCGPTQGDTATLDYDTTGVISGGTFIGTGASGMAQTFSDSEQGVISVNVGNQSADTIITLKDADGNVLLTHTPELPFAIVILSSPDLVKGEMYSLTVGTATSEFEAD